MTSSVNQQKHEKLNYINVFRAIAILLIVAGHTIQSEHAIWKPIFKTMLQDGTVLFVFISGFLFQYLSDSFSYPKYLKKKFFNIVCPYLFTSILGILLLFCFPAFNRFNGVNKLLQIPMFLTTGIFHNLPTWYIPMTCVFFLFAPVLLWAEKKKIFNGKSLLFCILSVLVLIPFCLPRYAPSAFVQPTPWQTYWVAVEGNILRTGLFFPVYILGMFVAAHRDKIDKLYCARGILWGLFLLTCAIDFWVIYQGILPGRLLAPKMILTFLVLGYLKHYDNALLSRKRLNGWLDTVAAYSFAIFFLHHYILRVQKFAVDFIAKHGVPGVEFWLGNPLSKFVVAFIGSFLLAVLIKKGLTKCGIKNTRWFIGV